MMRSGTQSPIEREFTEALDALIERVKDDRSILAAILGGSLSHDTVWARSDIDLVLVTIDDRKVPASSIALHSKGVNVHAYLVPRSEFRRLAEGTLRNSFMHSFLAKGRLLYTHDASIEELCTMLGQIGERDTEIQLFDAAAAAIGPIDKAHKWLLTRDDLEYTSLYILHAATCLARVEVIGARKLAGREVIQDALKLNPSFFKTIYVDLLNSRKTRKSVEAALQAIDEYVALRAPKLFAPLLAHLAEVGEARTATDIEDHFKRNFGISGATAACEYLAAQGLAGKAGISVQLTRRSNVSVEELAFFHVEPTSLH